MVAVSFDCLNVLILPSSSVKTTSMSAQIGFQSLQNKKLQKVPLMFGDYRKKYILKLFKLLLSFIYFEKIGMGTHIWSSD